jgi:F-type H+-transporting ATPase subunit a
MIFVPLLQQKPDIGAMIFEHTGDSHIVELPFGLGEWHLPGPWLIPGTTIDVSPTKHVVFMILAAFLVFVSMWYGGRQIERRHREGKGPRGFGGAIEALVLWVRNDVAVANIGHGGEKFAPYVLTLFFFILYCNLLGLLPWGSAATGNIAVTAALALTAFLTIEISGMVTLGAKGYIKTIVMVPPGMTGAGAVIMAMIMTPVELIGKIVKPFALTLRLFANMTAGHFVILVLLGLIFVFGTAPAAIKGIVVVGSVGLTLFMMLLELLVAFLQAYIFALLTSVFIGLMQHEH